MTHKFLSMLFSLFLAIQTAACLAQDNDPQGSESADQTTESDVAETGNSNEMADPTDLTQLLNKVVDVRMTNGTFVVDATVTVINEGKLPKSLKSFKLQKDGSKRQATVGAAKVDEIFLNDVPLDVAYDRKNRCVIHSVEEKIDRVQHTRTVEQRLQTTRDRYWKPLTEEQHAEFLKKHFAFLETVKEKMPGHPFRLVETQYFLFFTDLAPVEVNGYIVYLDAMYEELCKAFGLSPEKNIWVGKCVVVAFRSERDFHRFEAVVMNNNDSAGAQGLCHQTSDGTVIFSGFKGDNDFFAHVLVHETAHGFVHRYMTTARAPSWLNEGMSDWLANVIVKGDSIPRRQKTSAKFVMQQGGWGNFLTAGQIRAEHYGTASILIEILLARDKGGQFKDFFDGIKEGKPADESLKDAFGISYQDLQILYSQTVSRMAR